MSSTSPAAGDELVALRGEIERLRRERDALASRVFELEQELARAAAAPRAGPVVTFEDSFRVEQSRAKRLRLPLSVAVVELDELQEIRERLGHGAGEAALERLKTRLAESLRPTDVVSPLDGLAIGIMLTATTLEQALAAITRIQQELASASSAGGQGEGALSFSAGLVQWRTDEALGDLLRRASRALGQARRGGTARIVMG